MAREMKDSGVAWIGEIPKDWDTIKVKYAASITNGADPKSEGEIPVYGSGASSFKTCGEYKEGPTVLLGRKGATLHVPHYIEGKYWNVDTAFDVKTDISRLNLRLIYYLAVCFDYKCYISQTTLPGMTQTNYENMVIPCPAIPEQTKIVQFLDTKCADIDTVLAKARASIEEYKKLKQAIITQAITKGIRGDRPMRESGIEWIGEIPENWDVRRIKSIGIYRNGLTYEPQDQVDESEGVLVLRSSNVQNGKLDFSSTVFVSCNIPKQLMVQKGDILICSRNGSRELIGKNAIIDSDISASFGAFMMIFRCKCPKYMYYVLNSNVFSFYLNTFLTTTINQLTGKNFGNMNVVYCPDAVEQAEIVFFLDRQCKGLDELIAKKVQLINMLESYKKSLIYEYVTGKREVP